eukprot:4313328-Lingulodinium_polyedra.AAC.1
MVSPVFTKRTPWWRASIEKCWGERAFLYSAGLPVCVWPHAVRRASFTGNCVRKSECPCLWSFVHGE